MVDKKIALVTGANRGIGREIAKELSTLGWSVIATARTKAKADQTAREVGNGVMGLQLDVTEEDSVKRASEFLTENYPRLDALINNAGVMGNQPMLSFDMNQISSVMDANFLGPVRTAKYFMPLLMKSKDARIINISSGMGELSSLEQGGYAAYRMSKVSLNAFTILLATELKGKSVKVMSMCPGWVKTDMGGAGAPRSVEKGAETAVWLATSEDVVSGKFYRDRKVIPY